MTARDEQEKMPVRFDERWCKGCNICVAYCPKGVLAKGTRVPSIANPTACSRCKLCEILCPDYAVTVSDEKEGKQ
ncbi:MAG: 4Fe-4S binding protein [Bacillota bacterium]